MKKLNVLKIPRDLVTMRKNNLSFQEMGAHIVGKPSEQCFKSQDNIGRRKIKKVIRYIKYWG